MFHLFSYYQEQTKVYFEKGDLLISQKTEEGEVRIIKIEKHFVDAFLLGLIKEIGSNNDSQRT